MNGVRIIRSGHQKAIRKSKCEIRRKVNIGKIYNERKENYDEVKVAFFNVKLHDEIYMEIPDGMPFCTD